jgi:outer membrane receptor protein involved in Fe transport
MKLHLTLIALVLLSWTAGATNDPGDDAKGLVKGQIVDSNDGSPLEYATISIHALPDSNLVTGGVTNENGIFSIELDKGRYYLNIAFISYQSKVTNPFEVARGSMTVDLGEIALKANAQMLSEVEVRAERSRMQLSLDKRVFNVGKDLANAGGSASDVLDNVPSVTVDVEGNVSLRGSGGVRILINGRPSGLVGTGDTDGLRNIPANLIERVEVITNPSSRYEAEGMAGIINIILKEDKRKGLNGSVDLTAGYPDRYGVTLNTNYRTGKWNFFANYGLTYRDSPGEGSLYQEVYDRNGIGPDTTFVQTQNRDRTRGGWDNTFRGGLDYSLSKTATLSTNFTYSYEDNNSTSDLTYRDYLFNLDNPTSITTRLDLEDEIENNFEYVLRFRKDLPGKGHVFTIDGRYQNNDETETSEIQEEYFTPEFVEAGVPMLQQRSSNREGSIQTILQADYVRPFSEEGKFEAGVRAGLRDINTEFQVEEFGNGTWTTLSDFTNEFIYNEDVYAAYTSIGNKFGPISVQAGVRLEYTDIVTELVQTNEVNPRDYLNLFPSIFAGYEWTGENTIQASYSRRINRPNFWSLNPFFSFSDSRNIYTGNPNLDPEFTNSFELTYLKRWGGTTLSSAVYYRHTTGVVERIRRINDEGITFTQPENLAEEDAYGLDVTFSTTPFEWLDLDGNFNFFRSQISGVYQGRDLSADALTWFSRLTSKIAITKELDGQIRANYRAPRNTPQGRTKSIYTIDLSMSRDILNGKGTITASVNDLLNSRRRRYVFEDEGFFSEGDFQWRARQFLVTFSYRINQKKKRPGRGGYGGGDYDGGGY